MTPSNPALDQPQSLEVDALGDESLYLLANHHVRCWGTPHSDLRDLVWPGGGGLYARSINVRLVAFHGDDLVPMVSRYFPGYQETILGSESLIVSKRLAVPLRADDERAVLLSCECQAEADLVLRFDVEIDWGEPLTQRMVDGLLVAQRNPQRQQGIYRQSNAESTRVFGNPHAQPDSYELDDETGRARLVYHALVNGIADVSLLLTLSNVGEQVAWNGFLALRETERTFDMSNTAWDEALRSARIWTPSPRLNRLIQQGKRATLQGLVHARAGDLPASRRTPDVPALVDGLDALDVRLSRNLLAHLRRVAERSAGRLPVLLPLRAREALRDPGRALLATNGAYLRALAAHLRRFPSDELAAEHLPALTACAEALVRARADLLVAPGPAEAHALSTALAAAAGLARTAGSAANATRWQSEADDVAVRFPFEPEAPAPPGALPAWAPAEDAPWRLEEPWPAVRLAADAVWRGCGVQIEGDGIHVRPEWPAAWAWWALTGLPLAQGRLSLVWDGGTLHTSLPLAAATGPDGRELPVALHKAIRTLHTDEETFDLTFAFVDGDFAAAPRFRPRFAGDGS